MIIHRDYKKMFIAPGRSEIFMYNSEHVSVAQFKRKKLGDYIEFLSEIRLP